MADKKLRVDCVESASCDMRKCSVDSSSHAYHLVDECQGSSSDGPDSTAHKKKPTSFQITSVTVQGSRLSNDGGDDSADDLDESHTEDLSSEFLDCSKTTDLDNDQLSEDNTSNANLDELPMWSSPPIPVHPTPHPTDSISLPLGIDVPSEFRSAVGIGPGVVSSGVTLVTTSTAPVVNTQMPMVNPLPEHWQHRFKVVKLVSSEPFKRGRWLCMDFTDPPPVQPEAKLEATEQGGGSNTSSAGSSGSMAPHESSVGNTLAHVYEIPINQSYPGGISVAAGSQQPLYGLILPMHVSGIPGPQVAMMQPIGFQTAQVPTEATQPAHAFPSQPPQHQPQPLKPAPPPTQQVAPSLPSTHIPNPAAVVPCSQADTVSTTTQTNPQPQSVPVSQPPLPDASQSSTTTTIPPQPSQQTLVNQEQAFKGASQPAGAVDLKIPSLNPVSAELMAEVVSTHLKSTLDSEESESLLCLATELSRSRLPSPKPDDSTNNNLMSSTSSCPVATDFPAMGISSSGGSSTVAIDNKIEQAMDLVKSHLMFAVREEVDVLKEKITELMDRISQLEHENGVLRANASPETLSKLSQSSHLSTQPQQSAPQPAPQSSQIPPQAATPLAVPQQPPQPQQQHIQPAMVNTQSQTVPIPSQQQLSA